MKLLIAKILCEILVKLNVSVCINMKIKGDMHQKKNMTLQYKCDFHGKIFDSNGKEFVPPEGKFAIQY